MSRFIVQIMLPLVLMLLCFWSPTFAQESSTTSPCIERLQGDCGNITTQNELDTCCAAISKESFSDKECMCKEFNADITSTRSIFEACKMSSDAVLKMCKDDSTTPSTPFSSTTPPVSATPSSDLNNSGSKTKTTIIASVVVVVLIIVSISIICICRRKPMPQPNDPNYPHNAYLKVKKDHVLPSQSVSIDLSPFATNKNDFKTDESLQYQLAAIQIATGNFSNDNKIGRGGFGFVYKGTLPDGQEIAVKRLSHSSGQGDKEFKAEIELLAKLQHRNVVRLLGFCLEGEEALLVYELVPNKSLDHFLFDDTKREQLTWSIRFDIIKGIARGLLYLHVDSPLRTVHRDLKAANVLLDGRMNPKIADFGLARICALEQTHIDATRVVGTRGYMSPEYLHHGQFSVKSDVYAFGVIVLEIIAGRRVGGGSNNQSGELSENLVSYAWRCWGDEKPLTLMDTLLKDSFSSDEVIKCIHIGLLCVQNDMSRRPDMSTVVHKLNSNPDIAALDMPQFPGFLYNTSSDQSTTSMTAQSAPDSSIAANSKGWSGR